MSGAVRTMTPGQAKELAIILAQAGLTDLTYEQAKRLLANKGELNTGVRLLQARLVGVDQPDTESAPAEPAEPKPAHADICIERVIGGRTFRFRGFIRGVTEDDYVLGDTMLERVRAIGDMPTEHEDNEHLEKHRKEWVNDPELTSFFVITNERHPESSRRVRCFDGVVRGRSWYDLDSRFYRFGLVACRVA